MHVKGLQSEKAQNPCHRELLSPKENTVPALTEMPGLESNLYFHNLCASLCNRLYINMYFYIFIIKYMHSSLSVDIQLLLL